MDVHGQLNCKKLLYTWLHVFALYKSSVLVIMHQWAEP